MGSITRADLRNDIRGHLSSWPIPATLDKYMDANTRTLTLPDDIFKNFTEQKVLIEIGTEIMRVVDLPEQGSSIRVIRGFMGTTAAEHSAGAVVSIHPSYGWTDFELNNRIIPVAIQWLKPHAWIEAVSSTFTWSSQTVEVSAPSGVAYPQSNNIYRLEVLDTDGNYKPFEGWYLFGSKIRFNRKASADHTLRARIAQYQASLTDDTTTLDNDNFREAIALYGAHLAYNALKTNRGRYHEYAAALNDRASTPDELIRVAFDLKNQAIVSREENAYPRPALRAKTYREVGQ